MLSNVRVKFSFHFHLCGQKLSVTYRVIVRHTHAVQLINNKTAICDFDFRTPIFYVVWNVEEAENVGILASLTIYHFPFWFPTLKWSIREREGNEKFPFPKFGNGKEMKKDIPEIREREGNEKIHSQNSGTGREWKKAFPKFGNGKGMKKNVPEIRERESEAIIPGNGREREREWNEKITMIRIDWKCCEMFGK